MKTGLRAHDTTQDQPTPEAPHLLSDVLRGGLDLKLHLLQHYAELARLLAREILGPRGRLPLWRAIQPRAIQPRACLGATAAGEVTPARSASTTSAYLLRCHVYVGVETDGERPLQSYQKMKEPVEIDQRLEDSIRADIRPLLGLSPPRSTAGWRRPFSTVSGLANPR